MVQLKVKIQDHEEIMELTVADIGKISLLDMFGYNIITWK